MGRKNSNAMNQILDYYRMYDLDVESVYQVTKLVLEKYRGACWSAADRADMLKNELEEYCGSKLEKALIPLEIFASETDRAYYESSINSLYQTGFLAGTVVFAVRQLRNFPRHGTLYADILTMCYLSNTCYGEKNILMALDLERSRFYDRKKEAILLLGYVLGGQIVENLKKYYAPCTSMLDKSPTKIRQKSDAFSTESPTCRKVY